MLPENNYASDQGRMSSFFEAIKNNQTHQVPLWPFLYSFPKGGDIHSHLTGTLTARKYLKLATKYKLCFSIHEPHAGEITKIMNERSTIQELARRDHTYFVFSNEGMYKAEEILNDPTLSQEFKNKATVQHLVKDKKGHFFKTFANFESIDPHLFLSDYLEPLRKRARKENVLYHEVSKGFESKLDTWEKDIKNFYETGFPLDFKYDLYEDKLREKFDFLRDFLDDKIDKYIEYINEADKYFSPDSDVVIRLNGDVDRGLSLPEFFADLTLCFLMVQRESNRRKEGKEPRMLGIVISGREDLSNSLLNRTAQLKMIDFLKSKNPDVPFSPHAGELSSTLVSADQMLDVVKSTIQYAKPSRIGHATCIPRGRFESVAEIVDTLKKNFICLEVCLSSNKKILHINDSDHPLPWLLEQEVPVTLATDDIGVIGASLTDEYVNAVRRYGKSINYERLKDIARNALRYNFLRGEEIYERSIPNKLLPCFSYLQGGKAVIPQETIDIFLKNNPKANLQHKLELSFLEFERTIGMYDKRQYKPVLESGNSLISLKSSRPLCSVPNQDIVIGKPIWEQFFGRVDDVSFPDNIEDILNAPCPFSPFSDNKVRDTHILVLITPHVDGTYLTIENVVKSPKLHQHKTQYLHIPMQLLKNQRPHSYPYWLLMKKVVYEETCDRTYQEQISMLPVNYCVPDVFEVAICLLTTYLATGERLMPHGAKAAICVDEVVQGSHPVIGYVYEGEHIGKFHVHNHRDDRGHPSYGIAPVLRLKPSGSLF